MYMLFFIWKKKNRTFSIFLCFPLFHFSFFYILLKEKSWSLVISEEWKIQILKKSIYYKI